MELIVYDDHSRHILEEAINKYGYAPEHNPFWFGFYAEIDEKKWLAVDGDMVIMTRQVGTKWNNFVEPIAPSELRNGIMSEYINLISGLENINKLELELSESIFDYLKKNISSNLNLKIEYTLVWPVMDMNKYDSALSGSHYKSIRNARNKFYKENSVEIVPAISVTKKLLHEIVNTWKQKRTHNDQAFTQHFHNIIDGNFHGTETARAMLVNGKAVGFNAGWSIPNSNRYYAAIGIHDYSLRDLGLMLYIEDLQWLKENGKAIVDMGGVEEGGELDFKNQFLPAEYHKTVVLTLTK